MQHLSPYTAVLGAGLELELSLFSSWAKTPCFMLLLSPTYTLPFLGFCSPEGVGSICPPPAFCLCPR